MAISVDLSPALEKVMNDLVSAGRYGSKSEVLREGLRLVQEREAKLEKLHEDLEKGMVDIRAGRTHSVEEVFDELEAYFATKAAAAE
jgi:antitoxin ParD1/3/4